MQHSIELRGICVIYSVNYKVVDFIVTSQKLAIIGRVVVGELNPLKVRSGSAGLHLRKSLSHLTNKNTTI
jgi:hypothetical protein